MPSDDERARLFADLLVKQTSLYTCSLAQNAILSAEVRALLALLEEVSSKLREGGIDVGSPSSKFLEMRRQKIEETLVALENKDPAVAAMVQQVLDQADDKNQPN